MWKNALAALFALLLGAWTHGNSNSSFLTGGAFKVFPLGGGGFVPYFDIASDGSMVSQSDSAPPWGRPSHNVDWFPLVTAASMPSGDWISGGNPTGHQSAACAIDEAPSNPSILYMYMTLNEGNTYIYKATGGVNGLKDVAGVASSPWAHTDTSFSTACSPNGGARLQNPKLAISFADPLTVYVGTPSNGIYYTVNGGTLWNQLSTSSIPGAGGNYNLIVSDPSDATGNRFYATSSGNGTYKITSARTSPSVTNITGSGPTTFTTVAIDQVGTLWIIDGSNNLWRLLSGGTWQEVFPDSGGNGQRFGSIAVNPANQNQAALLDISGCLTYTTVAQQATLTSANFTTSFGSGACNGLQPPTAFSYTSTRIPWIQWAQDSTIASQRALFDPTQTNVLYSGSGIGFARATIPWTGTAAINWNFDETAGIENLDMIGGWALNAGCFYTTAQDRPGWLPPCTGAYPSVYYPGITGTSSPALAGDTKGGTDGGNQFAVTTLAGYSESVNGASSWSAYQNPASGTLFGDVIFTSSTSRIWLSGQGQLPVYSTNNGGDNFSTTCTFDHTVTGGFVPNQTVLPNTQIAQDSTVPTTVLTYVNAGAANPGFYLTTSGCAFTRQSTTTLESAGSKVILKAVPGNHCNFMGALASDIHGSMPDSSSVLKWSKDCGATWGTTIANVETLINWTFGATKPGGDGFPTFYCQCYVNTGGGYAFGFWEGDNIDGGSPTWTNLETANTGFPAGNADYILAMVGDLQTYGTVFNMHGGSGMTYRTLH